MGRLILPKTPLLQIVQTRMLGAHLPSSIHRCVILAGLSTQYVLREREREREREIEREREPKSEREREREGGRVWVC